MADELDPEQQAIVDHSAALRSYFQAGIQAKAAEHAETAKPFTMGDAIKAGWQGSATGLLKRGTLPDTTLPEDATLAQRLVSKATGVLADAPEMVAGGLAGAAAGAAAGAGVGSVPLAAAGAAGGFALPAFLRDTLMDGYKKGVYKDAGDFWQRAWPILLDTAKEGTIGAVTGGVGGKVAQVLGPEASPVLKALATGAAEAGTMTTLGAAFRGQVPTAQEFIENGILIAGMHGALKTAGKLRNVFSETGVPPAKVATAAEESPELKQQLASDDPGIPQALKPLAPAPGAPAPGEPTPEAEPTPAEPQTVPDALLTPDHVAAPVAGDVNIADIFPEPPPSPDSAGPQPEPPPVEEPAPVSPGGATPDDIKAIDDAMPKDFAPKPRETLLDFKNRLYQKAVNGFHSFYVLAKKLSGGVVPPNLTAGMLAELSGRGARANMWTDGTPTFADGTAAHTESASDILRDISKEKPVDPSGNATREFARYWLAVHADHIHTTLPEQATGVPPDVAARVANDPLYRAKYKPYLDRAIALKDAALQDSVRSGLFSQDQVAAMRKQDPYHANLYRHVEDGPGDQPQGMQRNGAPIKTRAGSDLKIQDVLANFIRDVHGLVRRGDTNRIAAELGKLADGSPGNPWISREDGGSIPLYENGVKATLTAHPDVEESWNQLSPQQAGVAVRILSGFAAVERSGFTATPDFGLRHMVRSVMMQPVISENTRLSDPLSLVPGANLVRGLGLLWSDKAIDLRADAEARGALQGTVRDLAYSSLLGEVYSVDRATGFLGQTQNIVRNALDATIAASHAIVGTGMKAMSLAEYKAGLDNGLDATTAALRARQIGLDYSRRGSSSFARGYNAVTAFQNAGVQGLDTFGRALGRDFAGTVFKGVAYLTAPAIVNWYLNHNDSRYKDAQRYQKDLATVIPTDKWEPSTAEQAAVYPEDLRVQHADGSWAVNNGTTFRVPVPFEPGIIFASLVTRFLDAYVDKNPDAWAHFDHTLFHGLPGMVPSAFQPIIEHFANRSMLTGNPLVNHMSEKLLPELRYNDYTSQTARILGKFAGEVPYGEELGFASPAVIQNYIHGWGGTLGAYALQVSDASLKAAGITNPPPEPLGTLADTPVIKAFVVRHPSAGMGQVEDFYSKYEKASETLASIKMLAQSGDIAAAQKLQATQPLQLTEIRTALGSLQKISHQVYIDPSISPVEKRQLIDGYYYQMSQLARVGVKAYRDFGEATK